MGRFYDRDGNPLEEPNDFPPHSVALQFLGTWACCSCIDVVQPCIRHILISIKSLDNLH